MKCHRCKGIMSYEIFYGANEHFWGWRCVRWGETIDPIILENRSRTVAGPLCGRKEEALKRRSTKMKEDPAIPQ